MRVLIGDRWLDGFAPYHCGPEQLRVRVHVWAALAPVRGAFFSEHGARKVLNYIAAYGVRDTWRKVRSRLAERGRNQKFVAAGLGVVAEAPGDPTRVGRLVLFVAPIHPAAVEEVCLHRALVRPLDDASATSWDSGSVRVGNAEAPIEAIERVMGWDPLSGSPEPGEAVGRILDACSASLKDARSSPGFRSLPAGGPASPRAARGERRGGGKPRAVLFGLGHYARGALIPRVSPYVDLVCCHEIDPTQLGRIEGAPWEGRTSPYPEPDERYDVYFAAGYHHTHARVAVEALRHGAYAVIEKPLATTREDLAAVLDAARRAGPRTFVAFQRRYSPFNAFVREDLALDGRGPVSVSALVYEVRLPRYHWYRWPTSRGRIVCNGCHWIDYFLFLNDFRAVASIDAAVAANGTHTIQMTLENDAVLSLVLTEEGSPRLDVREIVRVAARDRHAIIVDQCRYEAESASRKLRSTRIRRAGSFDRMYDAIARAVAAGAPGDSIASLEVSGTAALDAQDAADEAARRRGIRLP